LCLALGLPLCIVICIQAGCLTQTRAQHCCVVAFELIVGEVVCYSLSRVDLLIMKCLTWQPVGCREMPKFEAKYHSFSKAQHIYDVLRSISWGTRRIKLQQMSLLGSKLSAWLPQPGCSTEAQPAACHSRSLSSKWGLN